MGDGNLALFWKDRWNDGVSPCDIAPDLCRLIRPKIAKTRTVAEAIQERRWIADIVGRLTVNVLLQYIQLWHITENILLQPGTEDIVPRTEDIVSWKWDPSGTYTAKSAYQFLFQGATTFPAADAIWRTWAPLKVKFFMWLAIRDRLWTAERRHRRGLQDNTECALCDQGIETSDHLFATCCYT